MGEMAGRPQNSFSWVHDSSVPVNERVSPAHQNPQEQRRMLEERQMRELEVLQVGGVAERSDERCEGGEGGERIWGRTSPPTRVENSEGSEGGKSELAGDPPLVENGEGGDGESHLTTNPHLQSSPSSLLASHLIL